SSHQVGFGSMGPQLGCPFQSSFGRRQTRRSVIAIKRVQNVVHIDQLTKGSVEGGIPRDRAIQKLNSLDQVPRSRRTRAAHQYERFGAAILVEGCKIRGGSLFDGILLSGRELSL